MKGLLLLALLGGACYGQNGLCNQVETAARLAGGFQFCQENGDMAVATFMDTSDSNIIPVVLWLQSTNTSVGSFTATVIFSDRRKAAVQTRIVGAAPWPQSVIPMSSSVANFILPVGSKLISVSVIENSHALVFSGNESVRGEFRQ